MTSPRQLGITGTPKMRATQAHEVRGRIERLWIGALLTLWLALYGLPEVRGLVDNCPDFTLPTGASGLCDEDPCCEDDEDGLGGGSEFSIAAVERMPRLEDPVADAARWHELWAKQAQANKEAQRELGRALTGGKVNLSSGGATYNVGNPGCLGCGGMPVWSVSEPSLTFFIKDRPLSYRPPRGPQVAFTLAYKARTYRKDDFSVFDPFVYKVGYQWHCSWRWYVETDGTNTWVFSGGGSARQYTVNVKEYNTKSWLEQVPAQGQNPAHYVLHHASGARYVFALPTTDTNNPSLSRYFITRQEDAAGDALVFTYDTTNHVRLSTVTDAVGNQVNLTYCADHPSGIDSLVERVTDAWGRYAELEYDFEGNLTAITDAAGIRSTFAYAGQGRLRSLTTPYGTTQFEYFPGGSDLALHVSEPEGAHQFWVAIDSESNSAKMPTSYANVPNTGGLSNTFDNSGLNQRNTLHWGRRQYPAITEQVRNALEDSAFYLSNLSVNDYKVARLRHWLISQEVIENGDMVSYVGGETLSLQRDPHPETTAANPLEGQVTWFDYAGKPSGQNNWEGTTKKPRFIARVLPNGQTEFLYFERTNSFAHPTREISTYTLANGTVGTRTNTYTYSTNEIDLLVVTNASGVRSMSNWFSGHMLLTNYNALNEMTVLNYNTNHQIISLKQPNGLITTNLYATNGWLAARIDYTYPQGGSPSYYRTNAFTWEKALIKTHTDPRNLTRTFYWDGLRRLTGTSYPDGTTTSNRFVKLDGTGYYDGTGDTNLLDLTESVDRMGRKTRLTYNGLRQLTAATNTLGANVVKYDWCLCDSIEKITDALGQEIEFYYDQLGRMTNAVYYGGAYSVTNRYNLIGQLTNVIDPLGSVTNWYNNQGLLVATSNAVGRVKSVVYDIEDRPASVTDANGITVSHAYDNLGRLRNRTWPDNNAENWGYSTGYTGPTGYTNQLGGLYRTLFEYDPLERKIAETNANNEVVRFAYRPAGDLATLTDGKNQVTTWNYDLYGRVTNKVDAASAEIFRYAYDATGLLTNRWTKAKGTTTYRYDALGQLTNVVYPTTNSSNLTLQYDLLGRLTNLVDGIGQSRYGYANNRLTSEDGPWAEDTVSYSYQQAGPRSGLTLLQPNASPWTQSYGYDAAERLTSVASPAGAFSYAYDSARVALPGTLTLPSWATIATSYDFMARLTNTTLRSSQSAVLNHHGYGYNAASQRTSVTNLAGNTIAYTYDRTGQLIQASGKEAAGTTRLNEQFGYGYDAAGNLAQRTNNFAAAEPLVQTFSITNPLNQLTSVTRSGKLTVAGTTTTNATSVTVNGEEASWYGDATFAKDGFTIDRRGEQLHGGGAGRLGAVGHQHGDGEPAGDGELHVRRQREPAERRAAVAGVRRRESVDHGDRDQRGEQLDAEQVRV